MAKAIYHLQLFRGTTEQNAKYVGNPGELTVDIETGTLHLHDGKNKGGRKILSDVKEVEVAQGAVNDGAGNNIAKTYARLDGATFTGKVSFSQETTAPTVAKGNSSTNVATTAWVATADCVVHKTGNETIKGVKTFESTIQGTAVSALWADLAENYTSDFEYPYGTLICFGGEQEVTIASEKVNGVVSRQPALIMNRECTEGLPIALAGRVDVLVKGKVTKFDNIVLSDVAGVGVVDNEAPVDLVIGKALRDKDTSEVGTVLCATKFNLM